jgi:hypothetical protein
MLVLRKILHQDSHRISRVRFHFACVKVERVRVSVLSEKLISSVINTNAGEVRHGGGVKSDVTLKLWPGK